MGESKYSKIPYSGTSLNYVSTEPNSHFWNDLVQLSNLLEVERLNKEYVLIGLKNTIKNGYDIKQFRQSNFDKENVFTSIKNMMDYVDSISFSETEFYLFLTQTIMAGFNLTNGITLKRTDVYKRVDGERDYQDRRWNMNLRSGDVRDEDKPVSEWVNYMEHHLNKAKENVYHLNSEEVLAEIRKVVALGVRAMEIHGCPERKTILIGDQAGYSINISGKDSVFLGREAGKPNCNCDNCDCEK